MAITINGTGSITGLTAGGLPDGIITAADLANDAVTAEKLATTLDLTGKTVTMPSGTGGKILQVVQATKTDTDSTNSNTYVDITGFSASITPSSASSKILVQVVIGTFGNSIQGRGSVYQLVRGSTAIAVGDNAVGGQCSFSMCEADISYMGGAHQFTYLDSPATTSSTTYKVQWLTYSNTVYFNRSANGSSTLTWNRRGISQIILTEVAG